jgi:hypothetical protein
VDEFGKNEGTFLSGCEKARETYIFGLEDPRITGILNRKEEFFEKLAKITPKSEGKRLDKSEIKKLGLDLGEEWLVRTAYTSGNLAGAIGLSLSTWNNSVLIIHDKEQQRDLVELKASSGQVNSPSEIVHAVYDKNTGKYDKSTLQKEIRNPWFK